MRAIPITPSVYNGNLPVTAGQINQDMYTYDGTYFAAQGVMFHANKPCAHEAYTQFGVLSKSSPNGTWFTFGGARGNAISILDTSALFGVGADFPGTQATYHSVGVTTPGSSGIPGQRGGWVLMFQTMPWNATSGSPSAVGAGWAQIASGTTTSVIRQNIGTIQQGNTAHKTCAFAIDLFPITNLTGPFAPSVLVADPNSTQFTVVSNTAPNSVGQTPRFTQFWAACDQNNGATVTTIPSPQTVFTNSTPISHQLLNNTINQTLTLLNYPPVLNVSANLSQTIPTSSVTKVQYGAAQIIDTYHSWNSSTHTYTVPLSGVYFVHANIVFGIQSVSGNFQCGLTVNGSNINGPNYPPAMTGNKIQTAVAITRMLDLQAGDTVSAFAFTTQASGTSLSNVYYTRLIMVWLNVISASSGLTWTPPDVHGELLAAGTPPGTGTGQLVPIFNSKIANDLNFVLNKPYLLASQHTAQTGLANTTFVTINMDTISGPIHASVGDNYSGWDSTNHRYTAKVAGWYMAVGEFSMAPNASTAGTLAAALNVPSSGGLAPPAGALGPPDWYQELIPVTSGNPSAATALGLYYLNPGEYIQPQVQWINASGTFSTSVSSFNSTFSVLWICNLGACDHTPAARPVFRSLRRRFFRRECLHHPRERAGLLPDDAQHHGAQRLHQPGRGRVRL